MIYTIAGNIAQALLNYIGNRPYVEVFQIIPQYQQMKRVEGQEPVVFIMEDTLAKTLLSYLGSRPYVEVRELISALQSMPLHESDTIEDETKLATEDEKEIE